MTTPTNAGANAIAPGFRAALHAALPNAFLNWRDARFYARYGEVELHILRYLCDPRRDSIDVGANEGCYTNFMRDRSRSVIAFEPLPWLADRLRARFSGNVEVREVALSSARASATLRVPIVRGVSIEGCASIAPAALSHYAGFREMIVQTERLDDAYSGEVGFIKIDVEGHELSVLEGATDTIGRWRPRVLVEVVEYLSPGGVQRVTEFFRTLDYRGHFIHRRRLLPVQAFDRSIMQNARDQPDLTAPLAKRERFANFVYNFIFLPAEEKAQTAERIATHIAKL